MSHSYVLATFIKKKGNRLDNFVCIKYNIVIVDIIIWIVARQNIKIENWVAEQYIVNNTALKIVGSPSYLYIHCQCKVHMHNWF